MAGQVFPQTLNTWIDDALTVRGEEGRLDVARHLLEVYSGPLRVYFLGSSWRSLGEPEDIVSGFLIHRLIDRQDYMLRWRESGMRLRRWLMNGLCLYCQELRRSRQRDRSEPEATTDPAGALAASAESAANAEFARMLAESALERVRQECATRGLSLHFELFCLHIIRGQSHTRLSRQFGLTPEEVRAKVRTVHRHMASAVEMLLARDGVPAHEVGDEIRLLLRGLDSR